MRQGKALLLVLVAALAGAIVGTASAADPPPTLELLKPEKEVKVELKVGEDEPSLGGEVSLLVRNGGTKAADLEVWFLPAGSGDPIDLPGDSDLVFLEGEGIQTGTFFQRLAASAKTRLKGPLLAKVKQALPLLARAAAGRVAAADRIARSPALAGEVTAVLRAGVDRASPAAIAQLAPKLAGMLEPQGRSLALGGDSVRALLVDLQKTLVPPGPEAAAAALRGAFEIVAGAVAKSPLRFEKKETRPFSLRFELPPGESPEAMEGELILVMGEETLPLPVSGSVQQFKGVSVIPESLVMDSDHSTAEVTLAGEELAEFLRIARFHAPEGVLRDDAGQSVEVEVEILDPKMGNPHEAEATVTLKGEMPPGTYTGKVPLSSLTPEPPAVAIELHAHRGFPTMVWVVLAGVICGGLLTRLVSLAARRTLLLRTVGQSLLAFRQVQKLRENRKAVATASWHLEDLLEEPPVEGVSEQRLQGIPGLTQSIKTARSAKDLDEDTTRVLNLVARIQRWLRLEPAARRLRQVATATAPDLEVKGKGNATESWAWEETKTWRASRTVLALARREPKDVDAADALVAELLWQAEWQYRFGRAWSAASSGDRENRAAMVAELQEIEKKLGEDSKAGSRSAGERDALDVELAAFGVARDVRIDLEGMPKPKDPPQGNGVTDVKWAASPNIFTGWATLDGQSYGQLAKRVASTARANASGFWFKKGGGVLTGIGREFLALRPADFAWTLVALVLAAITYSQTKYSDTWGTTTDIGTAFMAGVTGTAAVKWAALPIFRSIRLRQEEGGGSGSDEKPDDKPSDEPAKKPAAKPAAGSA